MGGFKPGMQHQHGCIKCLPSHVELLLPTAQPTTVATVSGDVLYAVHLRQAIAAKKD